jgi:hypothetical protein
MSPVMLREMDAVVLSRTSEIGRMRGCVASSYFVKGGRLQLPNSLGLGVAAWSAYQGSPLIAGKSWQGLVQP